MMCPKICFCGEIWLIISKLSLLPLFSLPGQSPGRAVVLPSALVLAAAAALAAASALAKC